MASKTFIILSVFAILLISSAAAQNAALPCIQKILPCQPYLKSTSPPPAICCIPLNEVVTNDKQCLCTVFNNPELLQTFNITQDDALKFANSCQADADVSICKTLIAPTPSKDTPASPPLAPKGSEPSNKSGTTATHKITAFGGFIVFLVASVILFTLN